MPALMPCVTPVREGDSALVRILEAYIETLKAENEILRRRLADAYRAGWCPRSSREPETFQDVDPPVLDLERQLGHRVTLHANIGTTSADGDEVVRLGAGMAWQSPLFRPWPPRRPAPSTRPG